MSGSKCASDPSHSWFGPELWGLEGDYVKSAGHVRTLRPALQEELRCFYDTLLLASGYRACGASEFAVTARPDFQKDDLFAVLGNNVDFSRFSPEVTFQNAQAALLYQGRRPILVIVA